MKDKIKIPFTKMESNGNDFFLIEKNRFSKANIDFHVFAKAICDRHFGIGGDGLIILFNINKEAKTCEQRIYNSDGSEAEICGNGLRCIGKYLKDKFGFNDKIYVDTVKK